LLLSFQGLLLSFQGLLQDRQCSLFFDGFVFA
jgi:hypothetical protein